MGNALDGRDPAMTMPIHLPSSLWAASTIVAHPTYGTKTTSPGFEDSRHDSLQQGRRFLCGVSHILTAGHWAYVRNHVLATIAFRGFKIPLKGCALHHVGANKSARLNQAHPGVLAQSSVRESRWPAKM